MTFGEWLRDRRTAKRWSLSKAAGALLISTDALHRIEKGKTRIPQPATMEKIVEIFGEIPPDAEPTRQVAELGDSEAAGLIITISDDNQSQNITLTEAQIASLRAEAKAAGMDLADYFINKLRADVVASGGKVGPIEDHDGAPGAIAKIGDDEERVAANKEQTYSHKRKPPAKDGV